MGVTLLGFSDQAAGYIAHLPRNLVHEEEQVRFEFLASGSEALFRNHADPNPASRIVIGFHWPEKWNDATPEPGRFVLQKAVGFGSPAHSYHCASVGKNTSVPPTGWEPQLTEHERSPRSFKAKYKQHMTDRTGINNHQIAAYFSPARYVHQGQSFVDILN